MFPFAPRQGKLKKETARHALTLLKKGRKGERKKAEIA